MFFLAGNAKHDLLIYLVPTYNVSTFRLLGVNIDNNLKFSSQSQFVLKKQNSCMRLLCLLPQHTLKLILNCIRFNHTHYCLITYCDFLKVSHIRLLERKYAKCGRIILNDT